MSSTARVRSSVDIAPAPYSPSPPSSPSAPASDLLISEKPLPPQPTVPTIRLACLTCAILGVQIMWSVLMSHGTPYLKNLGFSSALTSLVWLAGPLGGVLVQPVMGMWSDNYVPNPRGWLARWGRRKPFILAGALSTAVCMVSLANVKEGLEVLGRFSRMGEERLAKALAPEGEASFVLKIAAVFWVYALNIAIQPLQAGVRAFVVDSVPTSQQIEASAWISRWNTSGAVIAFWLGSLNLPVAMPWMGKSQFKALTFVETMVLLVTIPTSFIASRGTEQRTGDVQSQKHNSSILEIWKGLYRTWRVLPRVSWTVCKVQFWAWLGWFPFLYYNTLFIGSLHGPEVPHSHPDLSMGMGGMGMGGMGLSVPGNTNAATAQTDNTLTSLLRRDHDPFATPESAALAAQSGSFASFLFALASLFCTLLLPAVVRSTGMHGGFLTVERLWLASHVAFAMIMVATYLVSSPAAGTALVACLGFSWAMTQWAPFALISGEISRLETEALEDREAGFESEGGAGVVAGARGVGAVFGLHNVAIAGPQVIAALECGLLFKMLAAFGVTDAVGWILRWAGLAALGAAWTARGLSKRR